MPPRSDRPYCGRFAPSPSGPLHAGSLFAAIASYLDARANGGRWLIRIEDIDPPREQPGADRLILNSLAAHGLEHDGDVLYQSSRLNAYQKALDALLHDRAAYFCSCSRRDFSAADGRHSSICPHSSEPHDDSGLSVRARFHGPHTYRFADRYQGPQTFEYPSPADDFILRRRDGLFAYQLAVVVDDEFQQITDVVRGIDLLDSTPRQIWLQQRLHLAPLNYSHVPVLVDEEGNKLSKQQQAPAINDANAMQNVLMCLQQLGFPPPPDDLSLAALLNWAVERWLLITPISKTSIPA